jgi:hypothetical protein
MDIKFYVPRGCYYLIQNGGAPYWRCSGLNLETTSGYRGNPNMPVRPKVPSWITNVTASTAENIAKLPCFNNIKVAAIIGDNFGSLSLNGIMLLGPNAEDRLEATWQNAATSIRASNLGGPATVSSKGGGVYRFLVEHFGVSGMMDNERHILQFNISGSTV